METRIGFINLYDLPFKKTGTSCRTESEPIFLSRSMAEEFGKKNENYITTVMVSWEE